MPCFLNEFNNNILKRLRAGQYIYIYLRSFLVFDRG